MAALRAFLIAVVVLLLPGALLFLGVYAFLRRARRHG